MLSDLGCQFDYYPNTRTSISAMLYVAADFKKRDAEGRLSQFTEQLRLQIYYYLSPRARLGAYVIINKSFIFNIDPVY